MGKGGKEGEKIRETRKRRREQRGEEGARATFLIVPTAALLPCLFIQTSCNHRMSQARWQRGCVCANVCLTKRDPYVTHRHPEMSWGNVSDEAL